MNKEQLKEAVSREDLAAVAREQLGGVQSETPHGRHGPARSVREAVYKGHQIRIETSYKITVDDNPVGGHVMVGNDGTVHYHSIPNQDFRSAVDMVKRIIDLSPPVSAGSSAAQSK